MKSGKLAGLCMLAGACAGSPRERVEPQLAVAGDSPIAGAIERVANDSGVPAPLLAAIAHSQTRFRLPGGHAHGRAVVGLLGLPVDEALRGARLAGVSDDDAAHDLEGSLRAGAALLRDAAPGAVTLDDY